MCASFCVLSILRLVRHIRPFRRPCPARVKQKWKQMLLVYWRVDPHAWAKKFNVLLVQPSNTGQISQLAPWTHQLPTVFIFFKCQIFHHLFNHLKSVIDSLHSILFMQYITACCIVRWRRDTDSCCFCVSGKRQGCGGCSSSESETEREREGEGGSFSDSR